MALSVITVIAMGPASAAGGHEVIRIIRVGPRPLGVAVDPATHTVYVANGAGRSNFRFGTVSVIDEATRKVTRTIHVGGSPRGVAVDPATHTVYVSNFGNGTVSVIDEATSTVIAEIPMNPAWEVAVDPAAHTAYATNFNADTVSVIRICRNHKRGHASCHQFRS